MTICFFSAQYLPTVGGVERYTHNLAREAVRAGHRAIVVTSALPELPEYEQTAEGIAVYRLPVFPLMNGRFPLPRPCAKTRALCKQLWAEGIDFCLIQTRFYPSSLYAALACKRRGIPAIVVDHSTGHMPMGGGLVQCLAEWYEHLACWMLRQLHCDFYGVSGAVCRWLTHFGVKPKGALYNAVDPAALAEIAHAPSSVNWRARLQLNPTDTLVAFAGRMIAEKGIGELMQAMTLPALAGQNVVLAAAGDGPLLASLQQHCPPNVRLLGSVPHDETLQLFAQADVYCLPTRYAEGFPTTFLEAAACGCAVVTTQTGGTQELFPDASHGILLESSEPAAIAQGLQQALADPNWRKTAAELTHQRLCALFTWQAVSERLLAIAQASQPKEDCECKNY